MYNTQERKETYSFVWCTVEVIYETEMQKLELGYITDGTRVGCMCNKIPPKDELVPLAVKTWSPNHWTLIKFRKLLN